MNARVLMLVAISSIVVGCATEPDPPPYRDSGEGRGRTTDLTTYDFQQYAAKMIDSLLADRNLARTIKRDFPGEERPCVAIGLYNGTFQFSATDKLKTCVYDTMENRLFKSGKFEIVDRAASQGLIDLIMEEMESPLVKRRQDKPFKQGASVDYVLQGTITEHREGDGRINDCYYRLNMKMYSVRTRKIVWVEDAEIRKVSTRPMVGW